MAKECGDCTFCCTALEVPEISKLKNSPCRFISGGCAGCSIYESRPRSCRDFNCLWLQNDVLGADLRPDQCGVMFEVYWEERVVVAITRTGAAWSEGSTRALINQMVSDGYAVWIMHGSDRHLILSAGDTEESAIKRTQQAWRRKNGRTKLH